MSTTTLKYAHITQGGSHTVELTQEEECAVLYYYDYGMPNDPNDKLEFDRAIVKLKESIWT